MTATLIIDWADSTFIAPIENGRKNNEKKNKTNVRKRSLELFAY